MKNQKPYSRLNSLTLLIKPQFNWKSSGLTSTKSSKLKVIVSRAIKNNSKLIKRSTKNSLIILFTGKGKTNKRIAVECMASDLEASIYRIDLSLLLSKYIGETEKNLNIIFNRAENNNWILFFDEADALFGKRTNVKDAHDKYANQEVSYLVQRIEDYSGLVILASNYKSNIDKACRL